MYFALIHLDLSGLSDDVKEILFIHVFKVKKSTACVCYMPNIFLESLHEKEFCREFFIKQVKLLEEYFNATNIYFSNFQIMLFNLNLSNLYLIKC